MDVETLRYKVAATLAAKIQAKFDAKARNLSAIDPVTIIIIINIILQIVKFILEYYDKKEKRIEALKKLNFFRRWKFWNIVKRLVPKNKERHLVFDALCESLEELTEKEACELLGEKYEQ